MSVRPRPYAGVSRYPSRGPTFIPRAPRAGGPGAGLGAGAGGMKSLIGGIAGPLLCLGCLAACALLGLFGTMIGAAAYMNKIQQQVRKNAQGAGAMIELNILTLFCALLCSIYILAKHRRGVADSS